jgi:hypothetical protein
VLTQSDVCWWCWCCCCCCVVQEEPARSNKEAEIKDFMLEYAKNNTGAFVQDGCSDCSLRRVHETRGRLNAYVERHCGRSCGSQKPEVAVTTSALLRHTLYLGKSFAKHCCCPLPAFTACCCCCDCCCVCCCWAPLGVHILSHAFTHPQAGSTTSPSPSPRWWAWVCAGPARPSTQHGGSARATCQHQEQHEAPDVTAASSWVQ